MAKGGINREKLNISTTLLRQLMATVCGIVIPRVMIGAFGSAVYGATTSIAQFLSYISLLEGGIGSVARGAMYGPLARKDDTQLSKVYHTAKGFFQKVGLIFIVYAVVLSFCYYDIADVEDLNRGTTTLLVLAISLSTVANYMMGFADLTLLNAGQRPYLFNITITVTNLLNTALIVLLAMIGADVVVVKLVSSLVFIVRPLVYSYFVKKYYDLPKAGKDPSALSQKWSGLGQHIAYFLHTNTDIVLLTLFADLKVVAVYSVYRLVATSIWNIASAFSGGMESVFGEMIAKEEHRALRAAYDRYKIMLTAVSVVLFGSAVVLILPFIKLYTAGITDADYIKPLFGVLILLAEAVNCVVLPCSSLPVSANRLKQTRWGAYCEAAINISLSLVLIWWDPLLGVAIGTLTATVFKGVYHICYTAKHFLKCSAAKLLLRFFLTVLLIAAMGGVGLVLFRSVEMESFIVWGFWGVAVALCAAAIALLLCAVLFPRQVGLMIQKLLRKKR